MIFRNSKHHLASKKHLQIRTNCPLPPKTPTPSMHFACNRHLSPGMDVGRAMGNPTASSKPTMHLTGTPNPLPRNDWCSHSCAATRAFPVSHPCSTPELLPTASSLYLILDFLHTGILPSAKVTVPSKGFERDCRLYLSGWAVGAHAAALFSSRIVVQCNAATRPSLPHLFQWAS